MTEPVDPVDQGDKVRLISVNVARPALLGVHRGHPVHSGIAKKPVTASTIEVGWLNLDGDGQADLEVHGGEDKAVYAYPSEHIATWSQEMGQDLGPAPFGENLTVAGWLESDVGIGDLWAWGDAILEVCQPRWPCYKLGIYRGDQRILARLRNAGRTGWYRRVLQTGAAPVAGPITVAERHEAGITVTDVHEARLRGASNERLNALFDLEPLADEWKYGLGRRGLLREGGA